LHGFQARNGGIMLLVKSKVDHNIGVEQNHVLCLPILRLFPKLARISCAVFEVATVFPKANQFGLK
jgi:hypothetical protein